MREPPKYAAPVAGAALLAVGLPLAVYTRVYVLQLLGTAGLLAGLVLLWRWCWPLLAAPLPGRAGVAGQGAPWTWQRALREAAPALLLVAVLVVLYHPLLAGRMPWQADHTVHQWKAWLLAEKLLPSGRLMGWTHQSGTGYPAEVLYPPLGDLWMVAVRYLSFGQLSWEATYALGFFGVLAFCTLAFYHLGRRLFGRVAGLAAALFVLTDVGGFREGGYVFTVQYGVWPLQLGITLGFLALLKFHDLLRTPGYRHLLRCGLAVAAALLAHPVTLIFFLVALPLYGLLAWLRRAPDDEPLLGRAVAGAGLGLLLAAFWLLPFFGKASGFSAHVTNQWKSMADLAAGIVQADLWRNAWAWPLVLGALGGLVALRERRRAAGYVFALSALLLVAGSLTLYNELRVANWVASARFVQFQRFVIFVKLAWFLLAGFLLQRVLCGLAPDADDAQAGDTRADDARGGDATAPGEPARSEDDAPAGAEDEAPVATDDDGSGEVASSPWAAWAPAARRAALLAMTCLLAAPFVLPLTWKLTEERLLPVGRIVTAADKGHFRRDFREVLAHLCREARRPGAGFFRVGYLSSFNDHEMANAATYCPVPEAKLSFIPSETFKYRAHLSPAAVPRSKEDLRALNVRFLMTNGSKPAPSWARQVFRRGRLALYEVPDYRPERYSVLRRVTGAGGRATFERVDATALGLRVSFADEEIRVRARDVPPEHFLVLHVAHFAAWRAYRGDRRLRIRAYDDLAPRVRGLMMVPLASGTTVFRYERLWVDHLSRLLTLLGLALVVFVVIARRRPRWVAPVTGRLRPWVGRLRGPTRWAALGVVAVAAVVLLAKACGSGPPRDRPRSLTHEIGEAQVSVRLRSGAVRRCTTFQMGRWICGQGRRWVGPVAEEWNLLNRFGLWAHPDEAGTLVITYPSRTLGRALEIHYGVLQSGGVGAPVTLDVFIDGKAAGQAVWPRQRGRAGWASAPLRIDTRARAGQRATLRFEVSTTHIGGRHFAFDPRIVPR